MDSHTYQIFHCPGCGSWFVKWIAETHHIEALPDSFSWLITLVATSSQSLTKCGQEWKASFFSVTVMMRWILDGSMAFTPPPSFTLPAKLMGYEIWKAPFASSSSTTKSGSDQKQDQIEIHVAFYLLPTLDMKSWLIRNWIWLHSSVWWWWWFDGSGLHFAYLIGCASYFIRCWWYCKRLSSPAAGLEQVA